MPDKSNGYTRKAVIELREKGLTFGQIGRRLGMSRQRAYQLYNGDTNSPNNSIRCRQCDRAIITRFAHASAKPGVYCLECIKNDSAATFGDRLRSCRVGAGMSRKTLAERSGLQLATIVQLEQGNRRPQSTTRVCLAEVLGKLAILRSIRN